MAPEPCIGGRAGRNAGVGAGHSIPTETIIRRYKKGIENLFQLYMPLADNWSIYDNSFENPELIAQKFFRKKIEIQNKTSWLKIQERSK
jgi:predicted ABC-type ATPase